MDYLSARVEGVEGFVIGRGGLVPHDLKNKIGALEADTITLEAKAPELKACRELLDKLHFEIAKRKTTLCNVQERVNELLAGRAAIEQTIQALQTLQDHSKPAVLNFDALHDIPVLEQRLERIEVIVRPLIDQALLQSEQIDAFLDKYERMMCAMDAATKGL